MFERHVASCKQLSPIALCKGLKYKNVVVNAAGSRRKNNDNIVLYVDIYPAEEAIANELLKILEEKGNFICDPITKQITN